MKKQVLMLTTSAFILACGAIAASAQQSVGNPMTRGAPAMSSRQSPGTPMMQQPDQTQLVDERDPGTNEEDSMMGYGMMGHGMMGHGMMGGMTGHGMMGHRGMMGPFVMRIIFALMDSDGDGTISLSEFQAAHEKIFKAMDANKDGVLSLEEMQAFMRGTSKSAPQQ
jgi:hypothetical protein